MADTKLGMLAQIRQQRERDRRLALLERALRDIARVRIMDAVSAIHMRAIATATLKVTPRPVA